MTTERRPAGPRGHQFALPALIVLLCIAGAWLCGDYLRDQAGLWDRSTAGGLLARSCEAVSHMGSNCASGVNRFFDEIRLPAPKLGSNLGIRVGWVAVPVAFLGLAYFLLIGAWYGFVGPPRPFGPRVDRIVGCVVICGVTGSIFLVGLMTLTPEIRCLRCYAVHVVNILLGGSIAMLYRRPIRQGDRKPANVIEGARATLTLREAVSVIVFACLLIALMWTYRSERLGLQRYIDQLRSYQRMIAQMRGDEAFLLREFLAQPLADIPPTDPGGQTAGAPRLVVFSDPECRACECKMRFVTDTLVPLFDGRLRVEIRQFPLSADCNEALRGNPHPNACLAARVAEAARMQAGDNAFRRMHELLLANRKRLDVETYRRLADAAGIDGGRLLSDADGVTVRNALDDDIQIGRSLGITGTPTLFFNDRRVPPICDTPAFWTALADAWKQGSSLGSVASAVPGARLSSSREGRNE